MERAPSILIIDDDPAVREVLAAILEKDGWSAESVPDGELAIERLRTRTFDAILLDLLMPRVPGEEVIAFIREQGILTPVIVISGASSGRRGSVDPNVVTLMMSKPIEIGDLRTVVRAIAGTVTR